MTELRFERSVFVPGPGVGKRLGRRLAACIGVSIFLHAAIVFWGKHTPVEANFQPLSNPFLLIATLRQSLQDTENPLGQTKLEDKSPAEKRVGARARTTETMQSGPKPDAAGQLEKMPARDMSQIPARREQNSNIDLEKAHAIAREYARNTAGKGVDPRFDADAGAALQIEPMSVFENAIAKAEARPPCHRDTESFYDLPLMLYEAGMRRMDPRDAHCSIGRAFAGK